MLLSQILNCCNFSCDVASVKTKLNEICNKVINILLSSGNECIPSYCKRHKKTNLGWNMFCKEPRQKSIFWHNIWCDGGRPRSGIVAELMRKSIARCHLSVKYIRKHTKKET